MHVHMNGWAGATRNLYCLHTATLASMRMQMHLATCMLQCNCCCKRVMGRHRRCSCFPPLAHAASGIRETACCTAVLRRALTATSLLCLDVAQELARLRVGDSYLRPWPQGTLTHADQSGGAYCTKPFSGAPIQHIPATPPQYGSSTEAH
jgi:hypothetical protein